VLKALPLTLNCPRCGSADLVYSCEPECCFNHVCGDCLGSFQLQTLELGNSLADFSFEHQERDCLAITVACARCKGLNVAMIASESGIDAGLVCVDCKALLEIQFEV
jgi:hypothetical protein